jgi:2-haloalkanoic acid dehalogenase type II
VSGRPYLGHGLEAVVFDLDGTLVDAVGGWHDTFAELWPRLLEAAPSLRTLGDASAVYDRQLRPYMHHAHAQDGGGEWDDAYVVAAFRRLLREHGCKDESLVDEVATAYIERQNAHTVLYADVERTLARLDHRYRLALVSNGLGRDQRAKIERAGLAPRFEAIVISEEVGLLKPDPAIFERALEALGVDAAAALYVGDNRAHDVAGAAAAGMRAVWLDRDGDPFDDEHSPDAVIATLDELPPLLGLE